MWYLKEINTKDENVIKVKTIPFSIGRSLSADLILYTTIASRKHCLLNINETDNALTIEDINSENGVFVNGKKIVPNKPTVLKTNDIIGIGTQSNTPENGRNFPVYILYNDGKENPKSFEYQVSSSDDSPEKEEPSKAQTNGNSVTHSDEQTYDSNTDSNHKQNLSGSLKRPSTEYAENEKNKIFKTSHNNELNIQTDLNVGISREKNVETGSNSVNMEIKLSSDENTNKNSISSNNLENNQAASDLYTNKYKNGIQIENITSIEDNSSEIVDSLNNKKPREDNFHSESFQSQIFEEDEIFELSSDDEDEDNLWVEKLSQCSSRSPPPEVKTEPELYDEEVDSWWQEEIINNNNIGFIDDIDRPKTELEQFIDNAKNNKFEANKQIDTIIARIETSNLTRFKKPEIIEAQALKIPTRISRVSTEKPSDSQKKSTVRKKNDTNQNESRQKRLKELTKPGKKSPLKTNSNKSQNENRKKRLKELTEKNKLSIAEKECKSFKKESAKPKVKVTNTNRSDLFLADITKLPSTSNNLKFKIPKTKSKNSKINTEKKTSISLIKSLNVQENQKKLDLNIKGKSKTTSSTINQHINEANKKLRTIDIKINTPSTSNHTLSNPEVNKKPVIREIKINAPSTSNHTLTNLEINEKPVIREINTQNNSNSELNKKPIIREIEINTPSTSNSEVNKKLVIRNIDINKPSTSTDQINTDSNFEVYKKLMAQEIKINIPKLNLELNKKPIIQLEDAIPSTSIDQKHVTTTSNSFYKLSKINFEPLLVKEVNLPLKPILKSINTIKSEKKKVKFNNLPDIKYFDIIAGNNLTTLKCIKEKYEPNNFAIRSKRVQIRTQCMPVENMIYGFTKWNPIWLTTVNDNLTSPTPTDILNNVHQVSLQYDNYFEYYKIFLHLLLAELWAFIAKEYVSNDSLKKIYAFEIRNAITINKPLTDGKQLTLLQCISLLSKADDFRSNYPRIGDMIIIKLPVKSNSGSEIMTNCFGYVSSLRKQPFIANRDTASIELLCNVDEPVVQLELGFLISSDHQIRNIIELIDIRITGRVVSFIKQFSALLKLPTSPLMSLILNPKLNDVPTNTMPKNESLSSASVEVSLNLNDNQLEAVLEVTELCLNSTPAIYLIQGPPGTGKTFVIQQIIKQIFYGNDRMGTVHPSCLPRVLICASSNAAIDQITFRLFQLRQQLPKTDSEGRRKRFRLLRAGQYDSMDPKIRQISVQELCKQAPEDHFNIKKSYEEYANSLLMNADVVCTTLGSCTNYQMERLSKDPKFRFTCCIVDEASQCIELDTLIPLLFGIDTLILVGDTCQLPPTVISQDAKKYGYGQSLFERIQSCNKSLNCIKFLTEQYRMHPEIARFPNTYFYNKRLQNSKNLELIQFPIIPYQLFLHEFQQSNSEHNPDEALFVVNMVEAILCLVTTDISIGIITPYQQQRYRILRSLEHFRLNSDVLSVNTIDSFQGQEKDIIILCCVRTEGIGFLADDQRLNVALTRARHAMYIVGNFQSLEQALTWSALKTDAIMRKLVYYVKNTLISVDDFIPILRNRSYTV